MIILIKFNSFLLGRIPRRDRCRVTLGFFQEVHFLFIIVLLLQRLHNGRGVGRIISGLLFRRLPGDRGAKEFVRMRARSNRLLKGESTVRVISKYGQIEDNFLVKVTVLPVDLIGKFERVRRGGRLRAMGRIRRVLHIVGVKMRGKCGGMRLGAGCTRNKYAAGV